MRAQLPFGLLAAVLLTGCGGDDERPVAAPPAPDVPVASIALVTPAEVVVGRGQTETVAVGVAREGFQGPVGLKLSAPPPGVEVVDSDLTVAPKARVLTFRLRAAEDAKAVRGFPVRVTATAEGARTVVETFKVTVR